MRLKKTPPLQIFLPLNSYTGPRWGDEPPPQYPPHPEADPGVWRSDRYLSDPFPPFPAGPSPHVPYFHPPTYLFLSLLIMLSRGPFFLHLLPFPSLPPSPPRPSPSLPSYVPGAGLSPRRVRRGSERSTHPLLCSLGPPPPLPRDAPSPPASPLKSSLFTPDAPPPTCPIHKSPLRQCLPA